MRIGVIGAGNVGGTLGRGWAKAGHDVRFGVPEPSSGKVQAVLPSAGAKVVATTVRDAAMHGEVVAFATPWPATHDAVRNAGDLAGKVILDCTNPLNADLSGLVVGHTSSGAEQVATWASSKRVVKIFNTTGFENMANPSYGGAPITMFLAGDDPDAKSIAAQLARDLGFEPEDVGLLSMARCLEPLAFLWIHMAVKQRYGTGIAFKLLRR